MSGWSAWKTFSRPERTREAIAAGRSAVAMRRAFTCAAVRVGKRERTRAAAPATRPVAADVPLTQW